eukprot:3532889-Lingulodinium_polyedra.AAC.1
MERAVQRFVRGHPVEVRALEGHVVAVGAGVAEMDAGRDADDPVGGRGEYLLVETLESVGRVEADALAGALL